MQQWYTGSMKAVCVWLTDRLDLQLHTYQLKTLIKVVKVTTQTSLIGFLHLLSSFHSEPRQAAKINLRPNKRT